MASALPVDTRLSGIISCAICLESKQGRNPKGLHCFHSFCLSCLQNWRERLHNKNEIDCPVCRSPTKLPENGIDGLADDFKVAELIDLMKSIGDPFVCQGCVSRGSKSRAKVKCVTCDRHLCEECYEFHRSSDMFDDHEVATELCELHGNKVTHVCVTCFLGLCVDCIFSRIHEKHDTCKLAEGIQRLDKYIKQEHKRYLYNCNRRAAQIDREKGKMEDLAEGQISILKGIGMLMKQELDAHISTIEETYLLKQKDKIKSWSDAEKNKYPLIYIKRKKDKDFGGISKLSVIRMELQQKLQLLKNADLLAPATMVSPKVDRSYFAEVGPTSSLVSEMCDRYQRAAERIKGNPIKIWSNTNSNDIVGLEVLEDCSALVAYKGQDHVMRIDTKGTVMGAYHLTEQGDSNKVQRITTQEGKLHILCEDNQSLITITTDTYERQKRTINNLSGSIYSLAYDPVGECFLFCQNPADGGKVFKCMKDNTDATQCSLAEGELRVVRHQGGYKIMVARDDEKEVLVFDLHGELLSILKQYTPVDVAMLDHEILLVADSESNRISMMNLSDDSFEVTFLSSDDGIANPWYIACKYPYLWVTGSNEIQLFKLG